VRSNYEVRSNTKWIKYCSNVWRPVFQT